jgi:hypothetical protein
MSQALRKMATNWKTITLESAKSAVMAYNNGTYGCLKNPDLDKQALEMFEDGLGSTLARFCGKSNSLVGSTEALRDSHLQSSWRKA